MLKVFNLADRTIKLRMCQISSFILDIILLFDAGGELVHGVHR